MFLTAIVFAPKSFALRTAIFPEEIRARAVIWQDQNTIFSSESDSNKTRPIWLHAGDSIGTAWGSNDTLHDLRKKAESCDLPQPGTIPDLFSHVLDPRFTWYAGSDLKNGALFSFLESQSKKQWVLISTALAGAMISQTTDNPLQLPLEVQNLNRVELVTLSIGANDVCMRADPFINPQTHPATLIAALKARISPNAKIFAFAIPPLKKVYEKIMTDIASLPLDISRVRLQIYCQQMWEELTCPAVVDTDGSMETLRQKINQAYSDAGVTLIDIMTPTQNWSSFDLMSSDCFHPSKKAQKVLFEESAKAIDRELFRNYP